MFRTINASISPALSSDFGLDPAKTGLLASVYFLVFAAAQIPIGVFLDRFGPRRVQAVLLVIAAGGATLFGTATGFKELLIGRAMIGLGVGAALMAGLKAIVLWFPKERVALVNGYMIMLGSLGAVTATAPTEWLLDWMGWRGLFEILTLVTVATAGLIYLVTPEHRQGPEPFGNPLNLRDVYSDLRFLRIAPLSAACIGSSWAMQSLWAAPWLTDIEGLDRPSMVTQLFFMAVGISAGAWMLGMLADRLRRRGVRTEVLLAMVAMLFLAAELAIILRVPLPPLLPWSVVSIVGAATVLSYAVIADYFPVGLAARANGALNLLHFGWAFLVQYGIGVILSLWQPEGGHYPLIAYQVAFGWCLAIQAVALIWFGLPWLQSLVRHLLFSKREPGNYSSHGLAVVTVGGAILEAEEAMDW